jgi:hypothetical protein
VEWSFDRLTAPEQRLFCCLGVFVGHVTPEAPPAERPARIAPHFRSDAFSTSP